MGEIDAQEMYLAPKRPASPLRSQAYHVRRNDSTSGKLYQDLSYLKSDPSTRKSDPNKEVKNLESLNKFINSSKSEPDWEQPIDHAPSNIASYGNLIFVGDEYGNLSIFEVSSSVICEKISSQKLNFTNIRNMSVNSKFLGVTYSCLRDKDIKKYNKKLPTSGICLFTRSEKLVCNDLSSFIKICGGFVSPRGLVLLEDYLFVSDKDLKKVHKINYDGDIIQTYIFDGRVFDISLNSLFLVASDAENHELYLIDVTRMSFIRKIKIDQVNKFETGPHHIEITNDSNGNLIFLNNSTLTEIYLYDRNLNFTTSFSIKFSKILNMTILNDPNQSLIIGSRANNNKCKLSCFIPK